MDPTRIRIRRCLVIVSSASTPRRCTPRRRIGGLPYFCELGFQYVFTSVTTWTKTGGRRGSFRAAQRVAPWGGGTSVETDTAKGRTA
jgi:hypothetical protein